MTVVICYNYFIVIVYFFWSFLLIMTFDLKAQPASISFAICGFCRIVSVFFFNLIKVKVKMIITLFFFFFSVCIYCFCFPTAVGFTNGCVRIMDGLTLKEEGHGDGLTVFNHCHDCITNIQFSHDSSFLATSVSHSSH